MEKSVNYNQLVVTPKGNPWWFGDDNEVVDGARVSFNKSSGEYTYEQNKKLISYLGTHEHYSPFGHCYARFHVKAPIFVARQLVKHKFLRWNEVSRRYVSDAPELYDPPYWRLKADKVKQGSSANLWDSQLDQYDIESRYHYATSDILSLYEDMIDDGICPEMARMILPQNMITEWVWSGSLDAFASMCRLRLNPHAQIESRVIAEQVYKNMEDKFPLSWSALMSASEV